MNRMRRLPGRALSRGRVRAPRAAVRTSLSRAPRKIPIVSNQITNVARKVARVDFDVKSRSATGSGVTIPAVTPRETTKRPAASTSAPNDVAATLADIARVAGVSAPTVSKVLNGRADVAPATRTRVEELLRTHGYRRRRAEATRS